jgi:hypothetical protein
MAHLMLRTSLGRLDCDSLKKIREKLPKRWILSGFAADLRLIYSRFMSPFDRKN